MRPVADGTTCKDGAIAKRGEKEYRHRNQRTAV
jgi:hypothetical protein